MSLTAKDLNNIRAVVVAVIDERVPPIVERIVERMFEEKLDPIMRQIADGFGEVHQRIDDLTMEMRQANKRLDYEVERNDYQDKSINQIRTSLHAA